MRKITVLDFCSRIGIASDEIPVVVKAGINIVGRYRSLYKLTAQAMPDLLEAKVQSVTCTRRSHPSNYFQGLQHETTIIVYERIAPHGIFPREVLCLITIFYLRDYFAPLRKSVEITRIKVVIKEYKPKTKEILPC